ncbi:hypothetical protein LCGC14_1687430 [marine sediment metagenome]|uniref:Uncharacterized protein n=1 Tax=marine sediment metagenome TaxID=412755 RepID=A0A0F9KLW2_9ZZZZ
MKGWTHVKINNGKIHYEFSSSKTIRSLVSLAGFMLLIVGIFVFGAVVFGSDALAERLTAPVLGVYSSLTLGVLGALLRLQSNWSKDHKPAIIDKFIPPTGNDTGK